MQPDSIRALNQLSARMNADGPAVMNAIRQLSGGIGWTSPNSMVDAFIRSANSHYGIVYNESVEAITQVDLATEIPVMNGILTSDSRTGHRMHRYQS